jgi:hypothetical protein
MSIGIIGACILRVVQLRAEGKRLAAAEQLTDEEVRGNRTREQDRKMIMITQ